VRDVERDLTEHVQEDRLHYPMESHFVLGWA
jgi:hypothetical protein